MKKLKVLFAVGMMSWALSSASAEERVGGGGTGCTRIIEDPGCMDACYYMSHGCPQGFNICYEDCIREFNCRYLTCV